MDLVKDVEGRPSPRPDEPIAETSSAESADEEELTLHIEATITVVRKAGA
jgi:hypothetical protein